MTRTVADRVVLDVGNSAVTVAPCRGAAVLSVSSVVHAGVDSGAFEAALHSAVAGVPVEAPIGIASVNTAVTARIVTILGVDRGVSIAPRDFGPTVVNACESPETVGLDRLFNASALDRDADFVIIDAGTAITVDRLARGVFQGGAIAPGIRICYRALHRETGALPMVEPDSTPPPALGRHTVEALRVGVERGLAGLVDRLVSDLLAGLPNERRGAARVVLTGGDAKYLSPLLRVAHESDPTLTLRGIARAWIEAIG